jgi:hypothetical protein
VTRRDEEAVVVLPAEEFERLMARASQAGCMSKFFADSPLAGSGVDLERSPDYGREVSL